MYKVELKTNLFEVPLLYLSMGRGTERSPCCTFEEVSHSADTSKLTVNCQTHRSILRMGNAPKLKIHNLQSIIHKPL
jgi:hypothetical protein